MSTSTDPQNGQYPRGNTLGVRRHRIAAVPLMSSDVAAELIVIAPETGGDERTLRTVSTARDGNGKRFVEVGLSLNARRDLIEALGGMVGPDWGDES